MATWKRRDRSLEQEERALEVRRSALFHVPFSRRLLLAPVHPSMHPQEEVRRLEREQTELQQLFAEEKR